MPIIKSARKRVKVAQKATARNARTKRSLRDALKAFSQALASGKKAEIEKTEKAALSAIDKAAKKAVIHKNKAARRKAQLSAQAKASGIKLVRSKTKTVKKAPAKKPAAVKKPAAKTSKSAAKTKK